MGNVRKMSNFLWTTEKSQAALLLAEGCTYQQVADAVEKNEKTIRRWLMDIEFSAEVDRLSVMTGIASKAERLRIAKRVVKQKVAEGAIQTDKDLLEWLKFAQAETDGIKLNFAELLASFNEDAPPVE